MIIPLSYYATLLLERTFLSRVFLVIVCTVCYLCFSQVLGLGTGAKGLRITRLFILFGDILTVMNDGS